MGRDKATLPFGPEMMLQRVVRLLQESVDPNNIVVVSAVGQTLPSLPDGVLFAQDQRPERGPLEGLSAGLKRLPERVEAAYVTSCDVPLLVPAFVTHLLELLATHDIVVPRDGEHFHPLAAVYRPSILPVVEMLLEQDRLRPRFLFSESNTLEIAVEDLREWDPQLTTLMNLNHPEQYVNALKEAGIPHEIPGLDIV
jgi:molybdopterin-guanine dinucleotide biosynthesis protein A